MPPIEVEGREVADFRGLLPVRKGAERYPVRPMEGIQMVVIHYSGVDADSSALQIAEYQTIKPTGDPFPECAYTFVVRWDGRIEQCHDLEKRTWHAGGRNNDLGIGVCLPGDHRPTEAQLDSTAALIRALNRELGRGGVTPPLRVVGHKELSPTLCPGPHWQEWRESLVPRSDTGTRRRGDTGKELTSPCPPLSASPCPVVFGFRRVYDYLGREKCGEPLAPERHDERGNSWQPFTRCEMRWDKAENRVWVTFETSYQPSAISGQPSDADH